MRDLSDIVIVGAYRTPIGKFNGALSSLAASDLMAKLIKETLTRLHVFAEQISEVIIGQVLTANQGQNPSRQASIKAGIPYEVPSYCINMLCGSGLKAVVEAYKSIKIDESLVILAGGEESMTKAPHCFNIRDGHKLGDAALSDTLLKDGLIDSMNNIHMGITAENVAKMFNIDRVAQDKFALNSQMKYKKAHESNAFKDEIIPIEINSRNGSIVINVDEFPRLDCSLEELSKLKPVFLKSEEGGTVTAGNASGINDGAAITMVMSLKRALEMNLQPLVKIVSFAESGVDPKIMGIGPVSAVQKAIKKANWNLEEVDLFEINEAFAAQSIAVISQLGIREDKVNVCGGAIALGHPIGASGTRVLVTLTHSLLRLKNGTLHVNNLTRGKSSYKGIAALCIGGGMGIAMCVETL